MKISIGICAAFLIAVALPTGASADAVYAADLSFSAIADIDGFLSKEKVESDALVNLARGRGLDQAIPANETLALVFDCVSGEASLVVFDVNLGSVLVTLATSDEEDLLVGAGTGAFGLQLDVAQVGDADNSIDGGYLVVTAQFQTGAGNCPVGIKATASGVLDVTITDGGIEAVTAVLLKGKASFSKAPIDQVP